jgi:undecaprenyl pyrophosphate synthase
VARAPLIRPTDAPPSAHDTNAGGQTASLTSAQPAIPEARTDVPRHVAIIMDGNRRWARGRGVSELDGHAAGVEAIREVLRHAVRRGIPVLTLYAFSR